MFSTKIGSDYKIEIPSTFHDYQIMKDIGKGRFSTVVLVQSKITSEFYAAKVISKRMMESRKLSGIIFNEINVLRSINHVNIVKLHEVIETEEYMIVITEYCSRGNLLNYLINNDIDDKEKRKIAIGIVESIKYLHENGIAHCDIKLENILLDEFLNPKLCDFNLSKKNDDENHIKISSSFYAAPEIFQSKSIDYCKADIWSLGIVLFALYEKRFPYEDMDDAIYNKDKLYIKTSNTNLEIVVKKCIQIDPSKRINTNDLINEKLFSDDSFIDYSIHNCAYLRRHLNLEELDKFIEFKNYNLSAYLKFELFYTFDFENDCLYDSYHYDFECPLKDKIIKKKYKKQNQKERKKKKKKINRYD